MRDTYKKVTQKNGVVIDGAPQVGDDIVLGLARSQEIARNQLGSLMDQLVKRMLTIRSRFAPIAEQNDGWVFTSCERGRKERNHVVDTIN